MGISQVTLGVALPSCGPHDTAALDFGDSKRLHELARSIEATLHRLEAEKSPPGRPGGNNTEGER